MQEIVTSRGFDVISFTVIKVVKVQFPIWLKCSRAMVTPNTMVCGWNIMNLAACHCTLKFQQMLVPCRALLDGPHPSSKGLSDGPGCSIFAYYKNKKNIPGGHAPGPSCLLLCCAHSVDVPAGLLQSKPLEPPLLLLLVANGILVDLN